MGNETRRAIYLYILTFPWNNINVLESAGLANVLSGYSHLRNSDNWQYVTNDNYQVSTQNFYQKWFFLQMFRVGKKNNSTWTVTFMYKTLAQQCNLFIWVIFGRFPKIDLSPPTHLINLVIIIQYFDLILCIISLCTQRIHSSKISFSHNWFFSRKIIVETDLDFVKVYTKIFFGLRFSITNGA